MPQTEVLFYRDDDGNAPLLDWLASLQREARNRCAAKLERLRLEGHDLRRPTAAPLGNDIYELRVRFYKVNYRMLYFFHGRTAAVVSHGLQKEAEVPAKEIKLALDRRKKFLRDPRRHTFRREE